MINWFSISTLSSVMFFSAALVDAANVKLVFDVPPGMESDHFYYSANWNPDTGAIEPGWQDFARFPMYNDGTHGDEKANDNRWSVQTAVDSHSSMVFEWTVDSDNNLENGWIGPGNSFHVKDDSQMSISFRNPSPEESFSRQELESVFNIDLSKENPPIPLKNGESFLFSVKAPQAKAVYLAGSFNNFANNKEGIISNPDFSMTRLDNGVWVKIMDLPHTSIRYKYVIYTEEKGYDWCADPAVASQDADSNTVLDLKSILTDQYITMVPGRELQTPDIPEIHLVDGIKFKEIKLQKTWVKPDSSHELIIQLDAEPSNNGIRVTLRLSRDLHTWKEEKRLLANQKSYLCIPAEGIEAPIFLEVVLGDPLKPTDRRLMVLPVVSNPSDDLRYGFYANWNQLSTNYAQKSDMLADLLINAVEYYDYFPAHGLYATDQLVYEFEPFFGKKIYAKDITRKIDSAHDRGILSIAYVAAYAASKSVFKQHSYPMTDEQGDPLIFNGDVMTERKADELGKHKWFWLMAIADDSPWHEYILKEWKRTLDDSPTDMYDFDGLEIDSYGHDYSTKYYSKGSASNGRLLSEVIADLISDAWVMAHETKDTAAVSFNCVNEFGVELMYDKTDFIFIENWAHYKSGIEEVVDICYNHRKAKGQRVVLKMYPADCGYTDPAYFSPDHLKLMMGMCITGGGSLMIAGEPDEETGEMHALNSLYYPDNVAIPSSHGRIIRDYNSFDAALYTYNHGKMVVNYWTSLNIPGCITRGFQNSRGDICITFLHHGNETSWNTDFTESKVLINQEIAINIPGEMKVVSVYYLSPDQESLMQPIKLDYEQINGYIRTIVPSLETIGAVIVKGEKPFGR